MAKQSPFIFPLRGLGQGVYTYELKVDTAFFRDFPDAPVDQADIDLTLTVDRRTKEMTLDFDFSGTVATTCDRCTADINLPIADQRRLIAKFVVGADNFEDEADLLYLEAETGLFDVSPYVYEVVLLSIPMIKTYDCREGEPPYPCDEDMLARINGSIDSSEDLDDAAATPDSNGDDADGDKPSPWDVLKDLN